MILTVKELQEKLDRVDKDVARLQGESAMPRQVDTLTMYKEYLLEELAAAKARENAGK
jgi:hypothetical protein